MNDLAKGLVPLYANLLDIAALENEDMLRIVFGSKLGPEGITRTAVILNEARAENLAHGILAVIAERRKRAFNAAVNKPEV